MKNYITVDLVPSAEQNDALIKLAMFTHHLTNLYISRVKTQKVPLPNILKHLRNYHRSEIETASHKFHWWVNSSYRIEDNCRRTVYNLVKHYHACTQPNTAKIGYVLMSLVNFEERVNKIPFDYTRLVGGNYFGLSVNTVTSDEEAYLRFPGLQEVDLGWVKLSSKFDFPMPQKAVLVVQLGRRTQVELYFGSESSPMLRDICALYHWS